MPEWLSKYIGLPYLEGGRGHNGVDCYGLIRLIYAEKFGIILPEYSDIAWLEGCDSHKLSTEINDCKSDWQEVDQPVLGDVIILRMMGMPIHIGLVVDKGIMIHSARGHNSAIERFDNIKWQKRIEGFYRRKSEI